MSIIVTPGESKLIAEFNKRDIEITIKDLAVGDIHINKDNVPVKILERKAKGDLDASIKDGRYREQKSRLIETGLPRKDIIYIIEALPKMPDVTKKRVWNAMCNSQHRDGFTVFQTVSVSETVDYIIALTNSVQQFIAIDDSNPSTEVNVNIKKRQVKTNEWFKYTLTLIPKCSLSIATVIVAEYPTVSELMSAIESDGIDCLANLKHGPSQRKIGKKLSNDICSTISSNY